MHARRRGVIYEINPLNGANSMSTRRYLLAAMLVLPNLVGRPVPSFADEKDKPAPKNLFARDNLMAWCIVPFDAKKRSPGERAAMLAKLGFKHFAYDYRAEHIPTFDAEVEALKTNGVALDAWWFPTSLNDEAKLILEVLKRQEVKAQLWVTGGGGATKDAAEQRQRVEAEANRIRPIAEAAAKIGCTVGLYNHGGWFGEPENQLAIIEHLKLPNVGIVYNQHHGHDHVDQFPALLAKMKPHLLCLNLNGMVRQGDKLNQKIMPLGQGPLDLVLLKMIRDSGYRGPIGIIGHTQDDAEARLRDNLDGLDWLVSQFDGKPAGASPKPRTPVPPFLAPPDPAPASVRKLSIEELRLALVDGRFGRALDARRAAFVVEAKPAYAKPPLTVECWTKLDSARGFNILVAQHPKESADHWELYSYAGTGELSWYIPGYAPAEIKSGVAITDGKWHHVAATFDGSQVRLFVDAKLAKEVVVKRGRDGGPTGPLWIGGYPPHSIGCDGLVDEVRVSKTIRSLDRIPAEPFVSDDDTIGLWHLDELDSRQRLRDGSPLKNDATSVAAAAGPAAKVSQAKPERNHWGKEAVGFEWQESDSVDDRWKLMDTGQFFSGSIDTPGKTTVKGIAIRVGERNEAAVCFDTELLRFSCGWTGDFLKFNPARYGLIGRSSVAGQVVFTNPTQPGWARGGKFDDPRPRGLGPLPREHGRYRGLYLHGNRVVLSYSIGDCDVLESPWVEQRGESLVLTRTLEIAPSRQSLTMLVCAEADKAAVVSAPDGVTLRIAAGSPAVLSIPPHEKSVLVKLIISAPPSPLGGEGSGVRGPRGPTTTPREKQSTKDAPSPQPSPKGRGSASLVDGVRHWTRPGPARWTAEIVTRGTVAKETAPYVVDTLTLPFDNPYRALLFVGGHDFFKNGDAAICTVHGDVWRVSGIDDRLERLVWKRFATGLFHPLGLRIVDDVVYVVGRDQITRLHDRDGNGEADFYDNFNNDGQVTLNGHEYVTCLETDAAGNFYYIKGSSGGTSDHDGCVLRVSRDGSKLEIVATGFRNANGLGIGPGDVITVAPQEGEWTPASGIFEVRPGGFYGAMPMHHRPQPPTDYDRPLCWMPRLSDNSSGGQVWVTSDRWGPLAGQLLHLSYGQCKLQLVLRETLSDSPLPPGEGNTLGRVVSQGGTLTLPLSFESGIMRGRFRPHDGQLYVSGLLGWTTSAAKDGCVQRVRYTGRPADLPVQARPLRNGLALTFTRPLDKDAAEDPDNYFVEQWNYLWSAAYGSPEYKVSDPKQQGRDEVEVRSATLLDDGKTVFLEIDNLRPVHQMVVKYGVKSADGVSIRQQLNLTIHAVGDREQPPESLVRRPHRGSLPEDVVTALVPGVRLKFRAASPLSPWGRGAGGEGRSRDQRPLTPNPSPPRGEGDHLATDARIARLMAWHVPAKSSPSLLTPPGPFEVAASGYLRTTARGTYRFSVVGIGSATLTINGTVVLRGDLVSEPQRGAAPRSERPNSPRPGTGRGAGGEGQTAPRSGLKSESGDNRPSPPGPLSPSGGEGEFDADVPLHRGFNRVDLSYRSPAAGDATLRLLWGVPDSTAADEESVEFFPTEPVPPTVWFCDPRDESLSQSQLVRTGRELFREQRCGNCHVGNLADGVRETIAPHPPAPSPPPGARGSFGPELGGARLRGEWVFRSLLDPRSLRHDATMPRLLSADDATARREAADLVAFLATNPESSSVRRQPNGQSSSDQPVGLRPPLAVKDSGDSSSSVTKGSVLFEDLGCIGCHRFTAPEVKDEHDRVSLHFVGRKFAEGRLAEFLLTPQAHFAASRMPDFRLSRDEAASLTAFVLDRSTGQVTAPDELSRGDAKRGRMLFDQRGCRNCHRVGDTTPTAALVGGPAIRNTRAGCLVDEPRPGGLGPRYDFTTGQRRALRAFLSDDGRPGREGHSPIEDAERLIVWLRCGSCHARDQQSSRLPGIVADESERGLPPEPLVSLTWTGEKLHATWLRDFVAGKTPYRPRPWLKARMPAFSAYAEELAAGLAHSHGIADRDESSPKTETTLAEAGSRLTFKAEGLDCRQCHGVGRDQPLGDKGTLLAPGINFAHTRERMRYDYYQRFMLDPPRYDIATRMLKLSADGRTTSAKTILDGDARRQFDALWQFVQTVSVPDK
jgi:cytochrome c551/c552